MADIENTPILEEQSSEGGVKEKGGEGGEVREDNDQQTQNVIKGQVQEEGRAEGRLEQEEGRAEGRLEQEEGRAEGRLEQEEEINLEDVDKKGEEQEEEYQVEKDEGDLEYSEESKSEPEIDNEEADKIEETSQLTDTVDSIFEHPPNSENSLNFNTRPTEVDKPYCLNQQISPAPYVENPQTVHSLSPDRLHVTTLPSGLAPIGGHQYLPPIRLQMAPQRHMPSKIILSARSKLNSCHHSRYVFNNPCRRKVVPWDVAMDSRPPLRIDMDGPTPCTYRPNSEPPHATASPKWSFGNRRSLQEHEPNAAPTSWISSSDVWTYTGESAKADVGPAPCGYEFIPTVGRGHPIVKVGPSHSIGRRRTPAVKCIEKSMAAYYPDVDITTRVRAPAYTMTLRRDGTGLWPSKACKSSVGPAAYFPDTKLIDIHRPTFSIQPNRQIKGDKLGPYAAF